MGASLNEQMTRYKIDIIATLFNFLTKKKHT
jgi:hypothetical protein